MKNNWRPNTKLFLNSEISPTIISQRGNKECITYCLERRMLEAKEFSRIKMNLQMRMLFGVMF